jgi:hypothetical protein
MATKAITAGAAFRGLTTSARMVDGSRSIFLGTYSGTRTGAYIPPSKAAHTTIAINKLGALATRRPRRHHRPSGFQKGDF